MTGPPRDWDKELAEIDRLMAKAPAKAPGPPAQAPGGRPVPAGPGPVAATRSAPVQGGALSTWFRVLLGVVLAGAMTQWPYGTACGPTLFLYTGASAVVVVAGLWSAAASWRRRVAAAHVLSLVVALWGLALLAAILLPRIGYARTEATWFCP